MANQTHGAIPSNSTPRSAYGLWNVWKDDVEVEVPLAIEVWDKFLFEIGNSKS